MCYIFKVKNGKFNKEIIWILQRSVIEILGGTKQYAKRWKYYKATALYSASILERIFNKLSRVFVMKSICMKLLILMGDSCILIIWKNSFLNWKEDLAVTGVNWSER